MAKIRKYNLYWDASDSKEVAGYKVYWAEGTEVTYDSKSIDLYNLTKMTIFDEVLMSDRPVMFGVTAIDFDGNESDITTLPEPFQVPVPKAPKNITLKLSDEFTVLESVKVIRASFDQDSNDDPIADAIESRGGRKAAKMKYYDDVGYRKKP